MPQSRADHVDIDASFEQMYGGSVAKDVRANVSAARRGAVDAQWVGMATDDLVEAETRERVRAIGREKGRAWAAASQVTAAAGA